MYYFLIVLAVVLFGGGFAVQDAYRRLCGSGVTVALRMSVIGGLAGLAVLLLLNGFRLEFTPFSFLIALLATANGIGFTFFSFRALEHINLSLYSVFSMLGGMVLPFLQGILFYREELTLAKGLCFLLIALAIFLPLQKGKRTGGGFYYAGVFVLNGLSGVLTKIFTSAPYEKVSAAGYSILAAVTSVAVSALLLLLLPKDKDRKTESPLSAGLCAASGAANRLANFLLVTALAQVEASVQYPMVTGGTMIVSTLLCYLTKSRPTKRELLAVAVAFLGTLVLFVVPI